jgi:hypothetical protein
MIIVKGAIGLSIVYDDRDWSRIIQIFKSLRLFRLLYISSFLSPLNHMIEAFILTTRSVFTYIVLIIVVALTFGCMGT